MQRRAVLLLCGGGPRARAACQFRASESECRAVAGAAGSGKSLLLRKMVAELRRHRAEGEVVVCAPTGIAAVNVAGVTIHSFAGIGLGRGAFEQVLGRVLKNAGACQASQSL